MTLVLAPREIKRWWVESYADFTGKCGWVVGYETYLGKFVSSRMYSTREEARCGGEVLFAKVPFLAEKPTPR
jgi:hypothetical protein